MILTDGVCQPVEFAFHPFGIGFPGSVRTGFFAGSAFDAQKQRGLIAGPGAVAKKAGGQRAGLSGIAVIQAATRGPLNAVRGRRRPIGEHARPEGRRAGLRRLGEQRTENKNRFGTGGK